jgi:hypothetical protein
MAYLPGRLKMNLVKLNLAMMNLAMKVTTVIQKMI